MAEDRNIRRKTKSKVKGQIRKSGCTRCRDALTGNQSGLPRFFDPPSSRLLASSHVALQQNRPHLSPPGSLFDKPPKRLCCTNNLRVYSTLCNPSLCSPVLQCATAISATKAESRYGCKLRCAAYVRNCIQLTILPPTVQSVSRRYYRSPFFYGNHGEEVALCPIMKCGDMFDLSL